MKLQTNFIQPTEIQDVVKLFFSDTELCDGTTDLSDISLIETCNGFVFRYVATCGDRRNFAEVDVSQADKLQALRLRKRFSKLCVYDLLAEITCKKMPWGSLTGIRPTKLAVQISSEGLDWRRVFAELGVSEEKIQLVSDILRTQGALRKRLSRTADLYVGIPFCVSRCSYCSFTSGEIAKMKKYVEPYVEELCRDISRTLLFARERGITLRNVYFGGGTPTSLSASQLDKILDKIDFSPVEFTVEAGRPDTLDAEKLSVLRSHGVQRVSVNPQTFNQSVLDAVGRKHTVADIFDKFSLAKSFGFVVNMDLIAGLPTETFDMFCHSVDCAVALSPENITVHTLALKHGSVLKLQNYAESEANAYQNTVAEMVDYAHETIREAGYLPYYMYRQKYMTENLENVGFCKPGFPCVYNIGIMEEVSDILACGTNAISKRISDDGSRIERSANAKDVITYIQRNGDYLAKKFALFDSQC